MTSDKTSSTRAIGPGDMESAYAARLAHCYVSEGLALLGEGVPALAIETSALQANLARGPLALLDEMSLEEADRLLHEGSGDGHGHSHGHGHGHEHGHSHEHAHAHSHEYAHGADGACTHDHGYGHGHGHGEAHEHGHDHAHNHEHERRADGERAGTHNHAHGHGHEHALDHAHKHEGTDQDSHNGHHGHSHAHSPAQPSAQSRPTPAPSHGMTTEAVYVLEKMAHGFGRMGRSAGRGFYDYEDGEEPELWSGLKVFERRRVALPPEDLRDRLLYAPIIEALRGLEEKQLSSPAEAERASLLAGNFSDATGGAIAFVDRCGVQAFTERAQALAERYGERFSPPALLLQQAAAGRPFGDNP